MDPLVGTSPLRLTNRRRTDTAFAIAFAGGGALSFLLAVFGAANAKLASLLQGPPSACTQPSAGPRLLQAVASSSAISLVLSDWWYLIPLVLILGLVGTGMVHALRLYAHTFVYAAMVSVPVSLVFSGIALAAGGGSAVWATLTILAALLWCVIIWWMRHGLRLTAALLEQAATVLATHPGILQVCMAPPARGMPCHNFRCVGARRALSRGRLLTPRAPAHLFLVPCRVCARQVGGVIVLAYLALLSLGVSGLLALAANGRWQEIQIP